MCKFNNRLFVFHICCLLGLHAVVILAKPLQHHTARNGVDNLSALSELFDLISPQDVHYDQRQKGEENYRIKLDGFFIGLPQEDSTALLLLTDDIFESLDDEYLAAFGKNKPTAEPLTVSTSPQSTPTTSLDSVDGNPSTTSENSLNNLQVKVVEIPAPKRILEYRRSVDSGSKTRSYISHFLNLLKRGRKY
ncbi:hypothetical protein DOY81_000446 [Sarcophaga bullata]|nr:hypothetical protein DOY81_000446 [Sarcophaga bullata]